MTTQNKIDPNQLVGKFILVPILDRKGYRKVIKRIRALGFGIEPSDLRKNQDNILYFSVDRRALIFNQRSLVIARPGVKIEELNILTEYLATYTTTPQKIDRAWKLLEQKEWIQGWSAKTEDGISVPADSPLAYKFCTIRAIARVYGCNIEKIGKIEKYVLETTGKYSVTKWNDHPSRTKEEVIKTLKELDL